jgi:hypothetical protein
MGGGGGNRLVVVRLDRRRVWRWHAWLVEALSTSPGCRVEVSVVDGRPLPAAVDLLLRLERLVFRISGEQAADLVPVSTLAVPQASGTSRPSLVIDLAGGPQRGGEVPVLRPLYFGHADEEVLISALLSRSGVELGFEGRAGTHRPAVDSPDVLTRALNTSFCALLRLCLQRAGTGVAEPAPERAASAWPVPPMTGFAARFAVRTLGDKISERLADLCRGAPRWRVGSRVTDCAGSLGATHRLPAAGYRALPDDGRRYYADPFLLTHEGQTTLFVEEYPLATSKGLISAAPVADDGSIGVPRPVLELDTHASYPVVFHHAGAVWMIPETSSAGRVDLYRAERVPDRWKRVATLLDRIDASDVTLTRQGDLWWLFAATREWQSSSRDTLCLYSAPDLLGPWVAHPANPVLVDRRAARPGGAFFRAGGALWRPAQDATRGYGSGLSFCRVDVLAPDAYEQTMVALLRPSGRAETGLHTCNFDGSLEVVDGLGLGNGTERFLAEA